MKKIKAYFKDKKEMEKLSLSLNFMVSLMIVLIISGLLLFFIFLLFKGGMAFNTQTHNIDLTLNFAQLCGDCIWDIKDMGTDNYGNFVNETLVNRYVMGMYNIEQIYYYTVMLAVGIGILLVSLILFSETLFMSVKAFNDFQKEHGKL